MMMRSTISEFDKRTVKTYDDAMRAYRMPAPHPEMEGVKYGEELMVFNPEEEDDDDEDDGDIIVRNKRHFFSPSVHLTSRITYYEGLLIDLSGEETQINAVIYYYD